ncbi:MAG: hypothetical protein PHP50_14010 [Lachnospiraceae bacterium]|nr:hypothetical protein [Lachnospiraceae bacterium]
MLDKLIGAPKTEYSDYKYCMQDAGNLYIGAKYTYGELMELEEIPFKWKAITEHYLMKEIDLSSSLESHLYYLEKTTFDFKTLKQLKIRVKVSEIQQKRSLFGRIKRQYVEKIYALEDFTSLSVAEKKKRGILVQELICPKLSLMSFSV